MHQYKGKLILHTGSMFSGKTSSLWKDINRFKIAKYKTAVFKPTIDTRYKKTKIVSHDNNSMDAIRVETVEEISRYVSQRDIDVIAIDEIQFLKNDASEVLRVLMELLEKEYTLVCAGLDMDYKAQAFEIIKELMPYTDYLNKHHAVCAECGTDAWASYRIVEDEQRIKLGAQDEYMPLCRRCYHSKMKEREAKKNQIKFFS